tara:strand:+ start:3389 stop:4060 length:672 start_codon:yes stop_codon:yes gene_type:complete
MIGKISGIIEVIGSDSILVDVGGVGYIVNISANTRASLPAIGEKVSLYTDMLVREDSIQLVGFISSLEKEWFGLLTSVQGVGAKAALAILGTVPLKQLSRSISLGNTDYITSAQGVGPKIAKRILLELGQKVLNLNLDVEQKTSSNNLNSNETIDEESGQNVSQNDFGKDIANNQESEAISALVNLGYDKLNSTRVVAKILDESSDLQISEIIRLSLQSMSGE